MKNKVVYTGEIPQCPNCNKPTKRKYLGSTKTLLYYPPTYNEKGVNTNPDKNTIKSGYKCAECENIFVIKGNHVDGFNYLT